MVETAVFGVFYRHSDKMPASASSTPDGADRRKAERTSLSQVPPSSGAVDGSQSCSIPDEPRSSTEVALPSQRAGEASIFPRYAGSAELPGVEPGLVVAARQAGAGPLAETALACRADQLGLTNPAAISLKVSLPGFESLELDAGGTGSYRPSAPHPVPWPEQVSPQATSEQIGLAAGTRILTSQGELDVKDLVSGDIVLALRGPALLPIVRVGNASSTTVSVAIEAGALGRDLPRRLLRVGADQPVFLEPAPVAAHTLVNGMTVRLVTDDVIDLFCLTLGEAEVLLAEGVPLASADPLGASIR